MTQLPEPSAPVCPAWCSAARCEIQYGRSHSSDVMVVERDSVTSARLALRLWRPRSLGAITNIPVLLELVVGDHDGGMRLRVDLSLGQADAVRRHLGTLLAMTEVAR